MSRSGSRYFERIRSNRNFLGSLFLSILAGGVFSLLFSQLLASLELQIDWIISLAVFIAVSVLALRFSEKSEAAVFSISSKIDAGCFKTLFETFTPYIQSSGDAELESYFLDLSNVLTKESVLKTLNINSLQETRKRINQEIQKQSRVKIKEFFIELEDMLKTIENVSKIVQSACCSAATMYSNVGYHVKNKGMETTLRKGRFRRKVMSYKFHTNLRYSVYTPLRCEVRISPFVDYNEFSYLEGSVITFLSTVTNEKLFLEIGLHFPFPSLKSYLKKSFERMSKQNRDELRNLMKEFSSKTPQPSSENRQQEASKT